MKKKSKIDPNRFFYKLCVSDILSVIDEDELDMELNEDDLRYIEKNIGNFLDFSNSIRFVLSDLKDSKIKNQT